MKATGIVRRIDDLGRVVIPKEIRRTMRIREGDPSQAISKPREQFCFGMFGFAVRTHKGQNCLPAWIDRSEQMKRIPYPSDRGYGSCCAYH